jgi:D-tyrosyl-tRNA(Tyr) deacylase
MRAVVSRVLRARVTVDGVTVGDIGRGLFALVGVTGSDGPAEAAWIAGKIAGLRVFDDGEGRMNLALADVDGAALVVSQFTLYGDVSAGRRPSYLAAARPEQAEPLVQAVVDALAGAGVPVATGRFGAEMRIESVADGPVTILLDSALKRT